MISRGAAGRRMPVPKRVVSAGHGPVPAATCGRQAVTGYHDLMKVLVVGASGRTGRLLAAGAVERGHEVTALVRAPQRLGALSARIHVVRGDVLDGGVVSDAVDGEDAVLVALGTAAHRRDPAVAALGTLNVVRSMQRYHVPRLVVLSCAGTRQGRDPERSWLHEHVTKPLFRGSMYDELRRMETSVRQSELGWTIVRAAGLTDGPARGRYRIGPGYSLAGGRTIARADVAAAMLDELERRDNTGHAVAVAS
jgi:putative NADH-flavin reductase